MSSLWHQAQKKRKPVQVNSRDTLPGRLLRFRQLLSADYAQHYLVRFRGANRLEEWPTITGRSGQDVVDDYAQECQNQLCEILSKRTKRYWLTLACRIPEDGSWLGLPNEHQYHFFLSKSIHWYSSDADERIGDPTDFHEVNDPELGPGLAPVAVTDESLYKLFEAASLCYELGQIEYVRNLLGRGASISASSEGLHALDSLTIEQSYDLELRRDLRTPVSVTGVSHYSGRPPETQRNTFILRRGTKQERAALLANLSRMGLGKILTTDRPKYCPGYISLFDVWHDHQPYHSAFRKTYGVDVACVFTLVHALCRIIEDKSANFTGPTQYLELLRNGSQTLGIPGGLLVQDEEFSKFVNLHSPLPNQAWTGDEYVRAADYLARNDRPSDSPSLLVRGTVPFIHRYGGDDVTIDFSFLDWTVYSMFMDLSENEKSELESKGDRFDRLVRLGGTFLPDKLLEVPGNDPGKEVDGSWRIGPQICLVAEAKAVNMRRVYYRGDHSSLSYRKTKVIDRALREASDKCRWLIQNRSRGSNWNLGSVGALLPIAISPFAEYLPLDDDSLWIEPGIPRVMTLDEVREFLERPDAEAICSRSKHLMQVDG